MPASPTASHDALFPNTLRMIRFALPVMLAGISVPLMGMFDVAVLGRLGDPGVIAGVGVAGTLFTVMFWAFSFLRFTTTGLVAQASGRGDTDQVVIQGLRPLVAALAGGLGLWLLQLPIIALGLWLIAPEPAVAEFSRQYFHVRVWGAPFTLAIFTLLAWFMGQGSGRTVLFAQLFLNGLNAVLTLGFVLGFGWGVAGAAWATVAAEVATTLLVAALALRRFPLPAWRQPLGVIFERAAWRRLFSANTDIVIRTLLLTFCLALITERGARFGTLTLAANQVLMQFFLLVANLLDGVSLAAEVFVGRAVGAGNGAALRHVVRRGAGLAVVWGGLIALAVALSGDLYLPLMTVNAELVEEAKRYWLWQAVLPFAAVWAFLGDGVFFGATRTRVLRNTMIVAAALYVAAAFGFSALWGNHGLWLALVGLMVVRAVGLASAWPRLLRSVEQQGG